jgi:hypothetical protein
MRGQFLDLLKDIGFIPSYVTLDTLEDSYENRNGDDDGMLSCVLCAGLAPNVLKVPQDARVTLRTPNSSSTSTSTSTSFPGQGRGGQVPVVSVVPVQANAPVVLTKALAEVSLQGRKGVSVFVHPSSVMGDCKILRSGYLMYLEVCNSTAAYSSRTYV